MPDGSAPGRVGRRLVRALDAWLRSSQGTFVFSEDPGCILRLSLIAATAQMRFSDGTTIAPGEQLMVLHYWNERLPVVPPEGPDIRWARTMVRQVMISLRLLAAYLASRPDLAAVRAVGAYSTGFLSVSELDTGGVFPRLGFEMQRAPARPGVRKRWAEFWENVYSWLLMWTYNPATLRGKAPWTIERFGLWMPRAVLEQRYGARTEAATQQEPAAAAPA